MLKIWSRVELTLLSMLMKVTPYFNKIKLCVSKISDNISGLVFRFYLVNSFVHNSYLSVFLIDHEGNRNIRYAIAGHVDEEIKKQEVKQRALLRRLYMDMEREQVKEYKKMKKELERITQ